MIISGPMGRTVIVDILSGESSHSVTVTMFALWLIIWLPVFVATASEDELSLTEENPTISKDLPQQIQNCFGPKWKV